MNHLVISRVNLEMDLDPHKYEKTRLWTSSEWNKERVALLNEYARGSLAAQTNQNFTFVSLWHKGKVSEGGELDNEIKITIERTGTRDDEPLNYRSLWSNGHGKHTLNYADQIRDKIGERFDGPVLVTNLDCDDCLKFDYVERVQDAVVKRNPSMSMYFNNHARYVYNVRTGQKGVKKTTRPSPTVSTWEPEIMCYPLRYNHSYLHKYISGVNVDGLFSLQTINSSNMFCKSVGDKSEFNLGDYVGKR